MSLRHRDLDQLDVETGQLFPFGAERRHVAARTGRMHDGDGFLRRIGIKRFRRVNGALFRRVALDRPGALYA